MFSVDSTAGVDIQKQQQQSASNIAEGFARSGVDGSNMDSAAKIKMASEIDKLESAAVTKADKRIYKKAKFSLSDSSNAGAALGVDNNGALTGADDGFVQKTIASTVKNDPVQVEKLSAQIDSARNSRSSNVVTKGIADNADLNTSDRLRIRLGSTEEKRDRHADTHKKLVSSNAGADVIKKSQEALDRLNAEHDKVRSAIKSIYEALLVEAAVTEDQLRSQGKNPKVSVTREKTNNAMRMLAENSGIQIERPPASAPVPPTSPPVTPTPTPTPPPVTPTPTPTPPNNRGGNGKIGF